MREKILKKLAHWHASRPWRMALVVFLLTVIFVAFFSQLKISTHTKDLLPEKDPKVVQFNKIIDEFATATNLVIVAQGEEQRIKEFADRLAPQMFEARDTSKNEEFQKEIDRIEAKIMKLKAKNKIDSVKKLESEIQDLRAKMDFKLFQRVDYRVDVDFLRDHMLMLVKEDDLENLKDMFMDPNLKGLIQNINNSLEKEYIGKEESISTREKEDGAWGFLDGIQNLILMLQKVTNGEEISPIEAQAAADEILFGDPYFISYDKSALIMNIIPTFSIMDRDHIMTGTVTAQAIVDDLLKEFPDVKAGLTGAIPKEHDEQVYSEQTIGYTTLIAFIAILILLMISFRMLVAPVLAIVNLAIGVIWALGSAAIVVGQLNIITSTMAVIILGLGIDFSIHFISTFTELRAQGKNIQAAMEDTFLKSGKGIITGGVTTACAFYALVISSARALKEMGLVMGTGLLAILLATMLFLPIMLVLRARLKDKRMAKKGITKIIERDISFRFLGRSCEWLARHYAFTIVFSVVLSGFLIWSAFRIGWDYDYRAMEPKGLTSMKLMDVIQEKFDLSMDYALVLTEDLGESRQLAEKYKELATVARTDDISVYVPSEEQQQMRGPLIAEISERIQSTPVSRAVLLSELNAFQEEIKRLEMNIMEMQDMAFLGGQDKVDNKCKEIVGDPANPNPRNEIQELIQSLSADTPTAAQGLSKFQQHFAPHFKESIIRMSSTVPIFIDQLPETILDKYSNRTRDLFIITVYPSGTIYDGKFLNRFAKDVERISEKATGTPSLFLALMKIFGRDGRNAILLTLVVVFFLLWLDFRNPRFALVAIIPLVFGLFWMVGLMHLVGIELSMMSVMGLPLIIGIGIDDGVHIMHRWRHEGNGKIRAVYSSTGKAIFLTSLTTMLAFGSLIFSAFPAWGQFGGALALGVGGCFLTTAIVLPGILGWIDRRNIRKKLK